MSKYQAQTRIYYTGDMANHNGFGVITREYERTKYTPEAVDIRLDDGREFRLVFVSMFDPSPGQRFWLLEDWQADRDKRIAEMLADRQRLGFA